MAKKSTPQFHNTLIINGIVLLLVFLTILIGVAVLGKVFPYWLFPVVLVGSVVSYVIVVSFLLRTQSKEGSGFSEKGAIELIKESFKLLLVFRQQRQNELENGKGR